MCEMNLWLKRLNKRLPPCRDGLSTAIFSPGQANHASLCFFSSSNVSYFIYCRGSIWMHFTTIHLIFMLINTPCSTQQRLLELLGFTSKAHRGNQGAISHTIIVIYARKICCSYSFGNIHRASWEQGERSHGTVTHVPVDKKGFVFWHK